ncbi:MAG: hypothetical protein SFV53_02470 [Rickettsiales bacterium]|nr:hypothetical protein [Rickettsiales bacterium]
MKKLNIDTAMILRSEAIDEYPLWSSDSQFVAANVMGTWHKFYLKNIKLSEVEWKQQKIGIVVNKDAMSDLTNQELKQFYHHSKNGGRRITTKTGEKIELKLSDQSSSLIITQNNAQPTVLWSSGIENCHSLSLSPNEKYVAYLCELNGMFVMRLK